MGVTTQVPSQGSFTEEIEAVRGRPARRDEPSTAFG